MCMYSVTAANSRDARQSEDLVITRAPHGGSNWMTEPNKPDVAVCVRNTAVLAVQLPHEITRGASFEQSPHPDEHGDRDFLNFLDGEKERMALNRLPLLTKIRVLHLFANTPTPPIVQRAQAERDGESVGVEVTAASRLSRLTRLVGSSW